LTYNVFIVAPSKKKHCAKAPRIYFGIMLFDQSRCDINLETGQWNIGTAPKNTRTSKLLYRCLLILQKSLSFIYSLKLEDILPVAGL